MTGTKPALFQDMVRAMERACFDLFIIEDSSTVPDNYGGSMDFYLKNAVMTPKFDPVPLVSYLAAVTQHIGIAPTLTSTFYPPLSAGPAALHTGPFQRRAYRLEHRDRHQ